MYFVVLSPTLLNRSVAGPEPHVLSALCVTGSGEGVHFSVLSPREDVGTYALSVLSSLSCSYAEAEHWHRESTSRGTETVVTDGTVPLPLGDRTGSFLRIMDTEDDLGNSAGSSDTRRAAL